MINITRYSAYMLCQYVSAYLKNLVSPSSLHNPVFPSVLEKLVASKCNRQLVTLVTIVFSSGDACMLANTCTQNHHMQSSDH